MFSGKAISRALCCYFFVEAALQTALTNYLLPETTGHIDEKVTEEITDQKFSKAKFLTTDAAHTLMIVWCFGTFFDVFGHVISRC